MVEITIWFLFILRNDEVGSVWDNIFDVNQVHCFVLKRGMRGEYLMCIVSAKITELGGRLKCQQGDTSWIWYYLCAVVGSPQIPYIRDLVVSTAGSNRRDPSLIPGRAENRSVKTSEVVKCLLKTNDERGGRSGWAILSATCASAQTQECKGSISSHCLYGQLLLTRFKPYVPSMLRCFRKVKCHQSGTSWVWY